MGVAARECVVQRFSGAQFRTGFCRSVETAQRQWLASQNAAAAHRSEAAR